MIKIYIIGHSNIDVYSVAIALQRINDSLSIVPRFTTDQTNIVKSNYFLDKETVNIAYKNNSLVSILTNDSHSEGITYDDYYNNDILYMSIKEFNVISDKIFNSSEFDDIVIWVDSSTNVNKDDIVEIPFLEERLENMHYLYFINEHTNEIANMIDTYISLSPEERIALEKEYS